MLALLVSYCSLTVIISLSAGYFVAILARFWPALAKSVVLINSAGNVVPGYSFVPFTKVSIIACVRGH